MDYIWWAAWVVVTVIISFGISPRRWRLAIITVSVALAWFVQRFGHDPRTAEGLLWYAVALAAASVLAAIMHHYLYVEETPKKVVHDERAEEPQLSDGRNPT